VFGGALKAAQFHHLVHEVLETRGALPTLSGLWLPAPSLGLYRPRVDCSQRRTLYCGQVIALCVTGHIMAVTALQRWESRGGLDRGADTYRETYQAQRSGVTAGAGTASARDPV